MTMSPTMQKGLMYGLPLLSFAFTWWLPAAVQLSFFAGAFLSFMQALIFRNPILRSLLGIPPLPTLAPLETTPYRSDIRMAPATPVRTVARSRALSTSELSSRFQPTTMQTPPSAPEVESSIGGRVTGALKKQFSGVEEFRKDMAKSAKEKLAKRQTTATRRDNEAYEKKRAKELKERRIREIQQRRAERAHRKSEEE